MITVPMNVAATETTVPVGVSAAGASLAVTLGAAYSMTEGEHYEGEYTFTPSDETQTIQTKNKIMTDNIVINPVPSNYGRISYNGSAITVY